jgi:hypothetical protein
MTTYAEINGDNIVVNVIVADAEFVASQTDKTYIFCTRGGIGWTYNGTNFVAPQPFASWTLDENHDWQPPIPKPIEGMWSWNEEELEWVAI